MIYLPPFWDHSERLSQVPAFCKKYPTAVIHYRWAGWDGFSPASEAEAHENANSSSHFNWPMPIHDTLRGYDWILQHLAPLDSSRRDVYVFGSYLGASLAVSLALTESHPHKRTAIRGCAAYNGIYNWTTFLPNHPIHELPKNISANILEDILGRPADPGFQDMKYQAETLFSSPEGLFDPFVSPCLFFHTPGLLVPQPPRSSEETGDEIDKILAALMGGPENAPRRSGLVFPPRKSTLKIPECLILHSKQPMPVIAHRKGSRRLKQISVGNHFRTQAHELAGLMRRSLEKVEFNDRMKWDDDFGGFREEMDRRIDLRDVGFERSPFEMPGLAQEAIGEWLEDRTTIHPRDQVSYPVNPENFWGTYRDGN
ncbi:uncharacterized protein PG998_013415 [Apiospora kogelbergensis]|uniref:uncharacterized protein n=1 Tax=Apiospora kogelbergensis TaxID=1337665 RepID=UPI00312E6B55